MKILWGIVAVILGILAAAALALAEPPEQAARLAGLAGVEVEVTVNGLGDQAGEYEAQVRQAVTGILTQNQVPVLSKGGGRTPGGGVLRTHICLVPRFVPCPDGGGYRVILISLDTTCAVQARAQHLSEPVPAVIWSTGGIGLVRHPRSPDVVQALAGQIAEFVRDFKQANDPAPGKSEPRPEPKPGPGEKLVDLRLRWRS